MSRPKLHSSNAAKQKAYRQRKPRIPLSMAERKALKDFVDSWRVENPAKYREQRQRGSQRQRMQKRLDRPFIAIDGEGYTRGKTHYYTMLSSSEGDTIQDWKKGLSTNECLEFLHQYHGKGILVGFYVTYDINMLLRDVPLLNLRELWDTGYTNWNDWHLSWMAGKIFKVVRDGKQVTWYDVFAFFQKSFIRALEDWKIAVPSEIIEGKADRKNFNPKNAETIKKYNLIECELLVKLMDKLRAVAVDCGYLPKSWHGAGALANVILSQNKVEQFNVDCPEMNPIFLAGYYGGRNQVLQQGEFDRAYTHDINSAYPYALVQLPSTEGYWEQYYDDFDTLPIQLERFAIHKVKWNVNKNHVLTPFPFRHKQSIYWPYKGSGWYWSPEVEAAAKFYTSKELTIIESWRFTPASTVKPFSFIGDLYDRRRQYVRDGNDAQIILKLGINACYGKVAQSIGYKGNRPAYQNYFWAGWITSLTRAMVFELAATNPDTIVSFATDGVISTSKLTSHNLTKQLGGWSVDAITNLFVLQPGVYCYDGSEHKTTFKSRGFAARSVNYERLRHIWREHGSLGDYSYKETRFIGLGSALQRNPPLTDWRRWIEQDRVINFAPNGDTTMNTGKTLRVYPYESIGAISRAYKLKGEWLPEGDEDLTR